MIPKFKHCLKSLLSHRGDKSDTYNAYIELFDHIQMI